MKKSKKPLKRQQANSGCIPIIIIGIIVVGAVTAIKCIRPKKQATEDMQQDPDTYWFA